MTKRLFASLTAAATIAFLATASMPLAGQGTTAPPLVITAYNGGQPTPYVTPRTPWGDPDLQGVWSSDDTSGIPMQRPQALGTQLYQDDAAWAARQKQIEGGIRNGENAIGSFRNDYATRAFRQTSLIVDPPDGRQPAVTPEAEKRRASRDRGTFGDGPFNTTEDFTLYDRCITRGIVGSVLRVIYGNGNRIVQGPGMVAISYDLHTEAPMYNRNTVAHVHPGADGSEVLKMHAVARIILNGYISNIQVSWVKEGLRMSHILLGAGVNDFGGTLINESISTAAGASYGQILKPKEIRATIRSAGRVPAQRSTTYGLLKVYDSEEDTESESLLDKTDPNQFGSYHELIKLDEFKYKKT